MTALGPVLDRLLRAGFSFAGVPYSDTVQPWVALAAQRGPTPVGGPLAHDVIVGAGRVGMNTFQYGSAASVRLCLDWTSEHVSPEASRQISELIQGLSAGVEIQPGAFWTPEGLRLKLYLGQGAPGALLPVCQRLGLGVQPDVIALAVDAVPAGLQRARSYRMAARVGGEVASLGALARAWQGVDRDLEGLAHPLLTSRGVWPEPQAKRSLVQTFLPHGDLEGLWELDRRQLAAGCPGLPAALVTWLKSQAAEVPEGLVLRPVAHEIDLFPDGSSQAETFVTLGEARP